MRALKACWKFSRPHLRAAAFPLTMAVFTTVFGIVYPYIGLPDINHIMAMAKHLFTVWGAWGLLFSAFLEGLYMVSFYYPGSAIIVLAVFFAPKTIAALAPITAICWVAFMSATVVNYYLGYYGLYRVFDYLGGRTLITDMHKWLDKRGQWVTFAAAFDPNYLAITNVCMGIAREPLTKTLLYSGLSMAVTGPILTATAAVGSNLWLGNGNSAFLISISVFYLWAIWLIWASIRNEKQRL